MSDHGPNPGPDIVHIGQLLGSAKIIAEYLVLLGLADMNEKKVFNWASNGRLPVKKIGSRILANKRDLLRHFGLE
jgi:hypothetical protein